MDKFNLTDRLFKYTVMDSMREWMIRFYIEKIQLDPKIETELCKYLEAGGNNNFSRGSITALLTNGLWCSIGVILRRNLSCHEQVVQFLCAGEGWPEFSQLMQILTKVIWSDIGAKWADQLFERVLPAVAGVNSMEQLNALMRISFLYLDRCVILLYS